MDKRTYQQRTYITDEATERRLRAIAKRLSSNYSAVIRLAVLRLYEQEFGMEPQGTMRDNE